MSQPTHVSEPAVNSTAVLASRAPRMWVGGVLLAGGLGLVVLGGCFLIGVWIMIGAHGMDNGADGVWSHESRFLLIVLYALAFCCVLGAAALIALSVRSLLGLLRQ